ncbi:MAG: twitching motility protein PilT [Bacteroidetes bacterium]|jgi:uncharacterized protein with PIN domain|nr:twitching motility protein PilT [Bacteroidota bacterium]
MPKRAYFRFYASLNDFLSAERQYRRRPYVFQGRPSLKDVISAQGVPPPEVMLLLQNGAPASFADLLHDGDRVSVFPRFHALTPDAPFRLQPPLPSPLRFLTDAHLGRLAKYLRMLGFDTRLHDEDPGDATLARLTDADDRLLLTRDRDLLNRNQVRHGYYVRAEAPDTQLDELVRHFHLAPQAAPFTRCLRCNGLLDRVDPAALSDQIEPAIRQRFEVFHQCQRCGQVYWKGSHFRRMQAFVQQILDAEAHR